MMNAHTVTVSVTGFHRRVNAINKPLDQRQRADQMSRFVGGELYLKTQQLFFVRVSIGALPSPEAVVKRTGVHVAGGQAETPAVIDVSFRRSGVHPGTETAAAIACPEMITDAACGGVRFRAIFVSECKL